MNIIVLVIVNLIILNVWLRMSATIFGQNNHPKRIRGALITGLVIAALLFLFPTIAGTYESSNLLFLGYCLVGFLCISLGVKHKVSIRSVISFGLFASALYLLTAISPLLGISGVAIYYSIVAGSEELLKFFSGKTFSSYSLLQSDIIIRSILLALGFSFLENILYALPAIDSLSEAGSILINRGATGYLMHSIFTGTIAYLSRKWSKKGIIDRGTLGAIGIGVGLHLFYNIIVSQHIAWLIVPLLLLGYGLLSYLLYASDSVYLQEFN